MRNLAFITTSDIHDQAQAFRRAFMEKTAVWNVALREVATREEACSLLKGKEHAFVVAPAFRSLLFDEGYIKGSSARLSQGCDVLYRGGSNTIAIAQVARSTVDCIERNFIPIYGARVVIFGSGSAALDMTYECSRAGVDQVTLLDVDRDRVRDNLSTFVEAYGKAATQILDTEQSREGHLTARRAYEHTSFTFGSLQATKSIQQADVCISLLPSTVPIPDYSTVLRESQIVCDPWSRSDSLLGQARRAGCDIALSQDVMRIWGEECAELLIEFGKSGFQ